MSLVLGLPHFLGLAACETLLEQKNSQKLRKWLHNLPHAFTLAEATALETPDLYANLQMLLPGMGKIEDHSSLKPRNG